ncbi:uncharacterized protein LOC144703295 [Wolffia australiana]
MADAAEIFLERNGEEEEEEEEEEENEEEEQIEGGRSNVESSARFVDRAMRFHPANIFMPIFSPPIPPSFAFRRPDSSISSVSDSDSSSDPAEDLDPCVGNVEGVISGSRPLESDLSRAIVVQEEDHGKLSSSVDSQGSRSSPEADSEVEDDPDREMLRLHLADDDVQERINQGILDLLNYDIDWDAIAENWDAITEEFGIIGENDIADLIASEDQEVFLDGNPPAAKSAMKHLPTITLNEADAAELSNFCAICKSEISMEEKLKQLPCLHHYHCECIFPWLKIRNTCPLCRFELPIDEPDYQQPRATLR